MNNWTVHLSGVSFCLFLFCLFFLFVFVCLFACSVAPRGVWGIYPTRPLPRQKEKKSKNQPFTANFTNVPKKLIYTCKTSYFFLSWFIDFNQGAKHRCINLINRKRTFHIYFCMSPIISKYAYKWKCWL